MKPNIEALQQVVRVLRSVQPEHFCLKDWSCGTAFCAIGHAAQDPWFIERGFILSAPTDYTKECPSFGRGASGWYSVHLFFNLSANDASYLFASNRYDTDVTIENVVERTEAFISSNA
jgi:hypothetical protein